MTAEACVMWIVGNGRRMAEYVGADNLTWVCAKQGMIFQIDFVNLLDTRLLAVASVDGLSVLDGKPVNPSSRGYIIAPRSNTRIPGWRLDDSHVACFEFGTSAAGYAQQMDYSTQQVGVIVCDFYEEKVTAPHPPAVIEAPSFRRPGADVRHFLKSTVHTRPTDDIAVAFGKRIIHQAVTKPFARAAAVRQRFELHYDTGKGLKDRGIGCEPPAGWLKRLFS